MVPEPPGASRKRNSLELKLAALTTLADDVLAALRDRQARIDEIHEAAVESDKDAQPAPGAIAAPDAGEAATEKARTRG